MQIKFGSKYLSKLNIIRISIKIAFKVLRTNILYISLYFLKHITFVTFAQFWGCDVIKGVECSKCKVLAIMNIFCIFEQTQF